MGTTERIDHDFSNMEDVIRHVDKNGRWQYWTTAKTGIVLTGMSLIFYVQGLFFIGRMKPECIEYDVVANGFLNGPFNAIFNETKPQNFTASNSVCSRPTTDDSNAAETCLKWNYSSPFYESTMVSDYDLICDRAYLLPTFQSSMFIGQIIGNPISGVTSDRYGRRMTLYTGYVGLLAVSLAMGFVQSIWWNIFIRVLCGVFGTAVWNAIFVLCMELAVPERRHAVGVYAAISWPIGAVIAAFMALFIRNWRQLCWATVLLAAATGIPAALTLSESPRWLVLQHRIDSAFQILNKVSKKGDLSGQLTADDEFLQVIYRRHVADAEHKNQSNSSSTRQVLRLLGEGRLRLRSFMLAISWIIVAFVFFGIMLYGGDALPNANPVIILGAMSIARAVSYPFYVVLFNFFGCRNTLRNALPLICILLLSLAFLPIPRQNAYGAVVYAAIYVATHVLSDLCMAALYIVTGELYPTVLRQTSLGFFSLVARAGSFGSSYAASFLSQVWLPLPAVVFAGASAIAAAAVLVLPRDVDDAALPDTIRDAHNIDEGIPMHKNLLARHRSSQIGRLNETSISIKA